MSDEKDGGDEDDLVKIEQKHSARRIELLVMNQ
jgi:hypothetical protein